MKNRKNRYWTTCIILVLALTVLGFTPVIIPQGIIKPMIFGIPYPLWASFIITVALVVLTYVGAKVHPGTDEEEHA